MDKIPLPVLVLGVLVVGALLILATGGHLPSLSPSAAPSSSPAAPQPPITGQSWDRALISFALAFTDRVVWIVPILLGVAAILHFSHVWAKHTGTLLARIAIGVVLLLAVRVAIVLIPHVLQFQDHVVNKIVSSG